MYKLITTLACSIIFTLSAFNICYGVTINYTDNFDDGNDDGWTHITGTNFHVENGQYSLGSTNDEIMTSSIINNWNFSDVTISVDVENLFSDTDSFILFGYQNSDNWLSWGYQNSKMVLITKNAGQYGYNEIGGYSYAGNHSYEVVTSGSDLSLFYDDNHLYTDDSYNHTGSVGLMTIDGHAHFDNFSVSEPVNPTPEPATMLLFGTGLAGLAGTRIRKKRK